MEKSIKRKIGVLVILGMFAAIALSQVAAVDVQDTYIDMDDGEWIGLSDVEGRIIFDDLGATDEIEILGAHVGIGTTTPDKLLHLGDDTSDIDGELRFEASNGEYVDLGITTSDNFYITGGNVGIGTVSPTSALEVNGDIEVQDDDWIGIGSSSERIIFDSNGDDIELIGGNVGIGTTGPVATLSVAGEVVVGTTWAFTAPPPPTGGMIIEGNVGIGTDSPQGALNVDNTGEAKGLGVSLDTYHIQTTNANPTIIATISTATDKAYGLTVTTIGIKSDGTEAAHYVDHATFKNDGGSLAAVGTVSSAHAVENDVSWGVTITPSGTNILVHVTGNTGDTVEWQTTVEMNIVGV